MKEEYKGHSITASAWQTLDTQRWEPKVVITWRRQGTPTARPFTIFEYFPTREQAISEGLASAKKMIDAGDCGPSILPPPLEPTQNDGTV